MDCTSVWLKKTFPDCEVAWKFSSARTKTEAIVISVLAPHPADVVLKTFEENDRAYCGVATDGGNLGSVKIFPVIIQYFDWKNGSLQSKLIEVQNTPNETADTIAHHVKETLEKNGLFEKCITFTGDNCSTMFGGLRPDEDGKKVFANLKKLLQKRTLIGVGCPAHILNNFVHHAAERMNTDIENIIFKIYQYFHIYTVQTEQLKEYCAFVDAEYRKLLSHSKTRWLSLFPGITRLIHMFPALKSFFLSQDKPPTVLKTFFEWITLSETPNWSDVEPCIKYLIDKGLQIDDVKCFDQVSNLKKFMESCNSDEEFSNYFLAHQKWTKYSEKSKNIECHSEHY
ncbi:unnamed protein product [Caretta caretta]